MLYKILSKLGYTKMEYLHQSRERVRDFKAKVKEQNVTLNLHQGTIKKLKAEVKKFEAGTSTTFNASKLKNWASKVKKAGCCDICDASGVPLSAHHIWAKSQHPTLAYQQANGVALCLTCHDGYHKKYHHIEDCNPYTYNEYKTDEQNKIRLSVIEIEVTELKNQTFATVAKKKLNSFQDKFKQGLSQVRV